MRHNASKTHRRRPKTPPRPIQDASKKKMQPSWGRLRASSGVLGRLGAVLGAFWGRLGGVFFAPWGRLFFGVYFGVILDHFGVDFGSNFRPFWGDEDDNDDDDDDHVHARRHENLNLTTYVSLFQTRSPELRAAALAEGLYNKTTKGINIRRLQFQYAPDEADNE